MSWCALDVRSPAGEREAVAAWLVERTGQAVEERDDGMLVGVAENAGMADLVLAELRSAFGHQVAGATRTLPDVDWRLRWRDGPTPRPLGPLPVAPRWVPPPEAEAVVLPLHPQTALRTPEHGSTRGAPML